MKKQGLLATDFYHMTVRQSTVEDNIHRIVWTVDIGQEKWRNIIEEYNIESEFEMDKLKCQCETLNFTPYPPDHPEYADSFVGLRGRNKVNRKVEGSYQVNFISEVQLPKYPPEIDVTRERTDEHFYKKDSKRNLPI